MIDERFADFFAPAKAPGGGELIDEAWFVFEAYNTQKQYGYGTAENADRYAYQLNTRRTYDLYAARCLTADELTAMPHIEDEGFNLSEAIDW